MMAKSHVVVGVAAWIVASPFLHRAAFDLPLLGLCVAGALLPDIDHPHSWVGRRTRPLSTTIARTLGHRGITHSALAVIGLIALLLWAGQRRDAVAAIAVGYLSHLAADMLTPRGLRLAWPLRRSWGVALCRTGSPAEALIIAALVGGLAWWVVSRHLLPLGA